MPVRSRLPKPLWRRSEECRVEARQPGQALLDVGCVELVASRGITRSVEILEHEEPLLALGATCERAGHAAEGAQTGREVLVPRHFDCIRAKFSSVRATLRAALRWPRGRRYPLYDDAPKLWSFELDALNLT